MGIERYLLIFYRKLVIKLKDRDFIYFKDGKFPTILTVYGLYRFRTLRGGDPTIEDTNEFKLLNILGSLSDDYITSLYMTNLVDRESNELLSDPKRVYENARKTTNSLEELICDYSSYVGDKVEISGTMAAKMLVAKYNDDLLLFKSTTDRIHFIGKGVLKGFNDEDLEKVLYSNLSAVYKLTYIVYRYVKFYNIERYKSFQIKKGNGKIREIKEPNPISMEILRALNSTISHKFEMFSISTMNNNAGGKSMKEYSTYSKDMYISQNQSTTDRAITSSLYSEGLLLSEAMLSKSAITVNDL